MTSCPTCGAPCGDEDLFCESDGTKLGAAATASPAVATNAAPPGCDACGATASDDGDGYCSVCGHRLDQKPAKAPAAGALAPGKRFGRFVVCAAARDGGSAIPRGPTLGAGVAGGPSSGPVANADAASSPAGQEGGTPPAQDSATANADDGQEVLLVLGRPSALAYEAEGLAKLASHGAFPRVIERDKAGSFLALSPPPSATQAIADAVQRGGVERAVAVIAGVLELAAAVEKAGFSFAPTAEDLLVAKGGSVIAARLRGARPLDPRASLDARRLLESLGSVLLAPAVLGPTPLVRLLAPSREPGERSVAAAQATVDAVRAELAKPRPRAPVAELCDPGLWRPYNQDATALDQGRTAVGEPFIVMVVCDGVSSSSFSDRASRVAARSARDALGHFARSPDIEHESTTAAVAQAIRAAHLAICAAHVADPVADPPGTTIAAAFIYKKRLTVGWVGDSRAYWLTPRGAELLTHDHSWVNEAIARGEVKDADEVQGALAHTITRCLGPLEVGDVPSEIEPDVRARDLAGPGLVVLCSDGLWNYVPKAADIAAVLHGSADETDAVDVSRVLINYALARGGQDNVSVAVYAHT